jgi:hypothetical protein
LLFYYLVNGEAIGVGAQTENYMSGEIVSFEFFMGMDKGELFDFDIILGTFIGKSEISKR